MIYNAYGNLIFGDCSISDYDAFSFWCDTYARPKRNTDTISVPGRNGDLVFDNGKYDNVKRTYRIQVTGTDNYRALANALLKMQGYKRLEDTYDPEHFMMAVLTDISVKRMSGEALSVELSFDRKPQRWLKSGEAQHIISARNTVYEIINPTLYASQPLIRFYGIGDVVIHVNSDTYTISGLTTPYIDVDSETMDAFHQSTNLNNKLTLDSGHFLELEPGVNRVYFSYTGSSSETLVVTPRWWEL